MRWFKRSSDKEILSLVRVNDRIQLEVGRRCFSRGEYDASRPG